MFDKFKPTTQMLGRWQPWHPGHTELFKRALSETGQVCIMIRSVPQDSDASGGRTATQDDNPFLVADVEDIGTFGDFFDGPTAIDDRETFGREEAGRRILNRLKFGTESIFITPFVYGVGAGGKALAKRGKDLAYSDSAFERWVDKFAEKFRARSF